MNSVQIGGFVVGMFQTNVYVVHIEGKRDAVLVDPGDVGDAIMDAVKKEGLEVVAVLLTHAHYDHIGGLEALLSRKKVPVYISEKETRLIQDSQANLSAIYAHGITIRPDVFLKDGEEITLAGITFQCISTPGHTEGSCCYYIEDAGEKDGKVCAPILLAGDTLFAESVGRTDFPTGSMSTLVRSIREKLFTLSDETQVFPGHGSMTTIGHEKQYNPMV